MQYNKQVARDKRIDNILNDVDILTEVEIIIDGL